MWDYDKLFAEGNIVGVKNCYENFIYNQIIDPSENSYWVDCYQNNELSCKEQFVINDKNGSEYTTDFEIQYIIRLDEHGNVVEKLFDRDRDMPRLMPELEDGMFIRVMFKNNPYDQALGFINLKRGQIVYQEGGYDLISNMNHWMIAKIVEVYAPEVMSFTLCKHNRPIWRDPKYQAYLDSKSN